MTIRRSTLRRLVEITDLAYSFRDDFGAVPNDFSAEAARANVDAWNRMQAFAARSELRAEMDGDFFFGREHTLLMTSPVTLVPAAR